MSIPLPPTSCPSCHEPAETDDRFCAFCGAIVVPAPIAGSRAAPSRPPQSTPATSGPQATKEELAWAAIQARLTKATIGRYEILDLLGSGGMAAVFLAHHISLNRKVAIKVLAPGLLQASGMVDRFLSEARTIAQFRSAHIVTVFEVEQFDDLYYFVMEYVRGAALDQILQSSGPLPLDLIRGILFEVAAGLTYAHRRGVVHRDIKPSNIMIDEDGRSVVMDFGIAKSAESENLLLTVGTIGTPAYMSPEQCNGQPLTGASDQYSLGVVAYEMLVGAPPFQGRSYAVQAAHVSQDPPPIEQKRDDCPADLAAAVMRMLAKKSEARWPTLAEAIAALGCRPIDDSDPVRQRLSQVAGRINGQLSSGFAATPRSASGSVSVARVSIAGTGESLTSGDTAQLTAQVLGPGGEILDRRAVLWSSTRTEIMSVNASGLITAHLAGTSRITARCEGKEASVEVQVAEPSVGQVEFLAPLEPLREGQTIDLTVVVRDRKGKILTDRSIAFVSSDVAIARVSRSGQLTAGRSGRAKVSAMCSGVSGSCEVTVLRTPIALIDILGPGRPLATAESFQLSVRVADAAGKLLEDRSLAWASSRPNIVAVSAEGRLTALAPGGATIQASGEGTVAEVSVEVAEPRVSRVEIIAPATRITAGDRTKLLARVERADGRPAGDRQIRWFASDDAVATIDSDGTVTARSPGSVRIVAECDGVRGEVVLAVAPDEVVPVPLAQSGPDGSSHRSRLPLVVGGGAAIALVLAFLVFSGVFEPETVQEKGQVGSSTGTSATSSKDGTTERSPTPPAPPPSPGGTDPTLARIEIISPVNAVPLFLGDSVQLRAQGVDQAGRRASPPALRWSVSPEDVAVQRNGYLIGRRAGQARVVATGPGSLVSDTRRVTVSVPPLDSLVIVGVPESLLINTTVPLHTRARDRRARPLPDPVITWTTSNPAVAVISAAGVVEGRGPGTASVVAEAEGQRTEALIRVVRPTSATGATGSTEGGGSVEGEGLAPSAEALLAEVEKFVGQLRAKDVAAVTSVYKVETRSDRQNLDALVSLMKTTDYSLRVPGDAVVLGVPRGGGSTATWSYRIHLFWKTSFGSSRDEQVTFQGVFSQTSRGWHLTEVRIEGKPKIG